ncbi:MAG: hypothetical protein ACE5FG_01865 [Myxococcota bacterium]
MSQDRATPRSLPGAPTAVFAALTAIGLISFLVGLGVDSGRTYRVFLHNWLLWAALSQAAIVLSSTFRLTNATWMGPVRRVVDSMGAFVPVSLLLFAVIYMGRHELFAWIEEPVHGKEWWYEEGFVFARDLGVLLWMTALTLLYLYLSVRPMLAAARETSSGWRGGLYQRWTAGWRGEAEERDLAERRLRKLAAVICLSYALCYSLIGVDMIMSLAPHWVSTMFPAYFAWGGWLSAVAMTALLCLVLSRSDGLVGEITASRRHDMGKMIFAFSIFWMYLFWSQYLVIWYGNVPEETSFVVARLGSQFIQDTWYLTGFWERIAEPYARLTLSAWILCWVVPFWVLLGQRPKKTPAILGPVAFGLLVGFWLERYILVTPSLVSPAAVTAGAPVTPFGWIELGVGAGFVGAFALCFLAFGRVFPGVLPTSR